MSKEMNEILNRTLDENEIKNFYKDYQSRIEQIKSNLNMKEMNLSKKSVKFSKNIKKKGEN